MCPLNPIKVYHRDGQMDTTNWLLIHKPKKVRPFFPESEQDEKTVINEWRHSATIDEIPVTISAYQFMAVSCSCGIVSHVAEEKANLGVRDR